jgi:transcriptional regulator with XRE-family HTH domain
MKFKDKYNVNNEFEHLFTFKNKKQELEHEARMIMFRFLSELENINKSENLLKKKELAQKIGVSASYITQIFNGAKLANFNLLAKIQDAFNITFEIKARPNDTLYSVNELTPESFPTNLTEREGLWVWHNFKKPDYASKNVCCESNINNPEDPKVSAA